MMILHLTKYVMAFINNRYILLFLLFFMLQNDSSKAQVFNHFNNIENSNDTLYNLRYFKNIDAKIKEKLDSFFLLIKYNKKLTRKGVIYYNTDSGFITVGFYRKPKSKNLILYIKLNNTYGDYLSITNTQNKYQNLFGFTYYKSHTVLLNLEYSKLKINDDFIPLLKDIIVPELSTSVQKEIIKNANEYEINSYGVFKKYIIEIKDNK